MTQRRDHKPEPVDTMMPKGRRWRCGVCGDYVHEVYNRMLPVRRRKYWRHVKTDPCGGCP